MSHSFASAVKQPPKLMAYRPPQDSPRPIILAIIASDQSSSGAVIERSAQLASAMGGNLAVHVFRTPLRASSGAFAGQTLDSVMKIASAHIPHDRVYVSNINQGDLSRHVQKACENMEPVCIVIPANTGGTSIAGAALRRKWLTGHCPAPLWLVAENAAAPRPIVLAALDSITNSQAASSVTKGILQNSRYLADLFNAELHIFHSTLAFNMPDEILTELREIRQQSIERWLNDLQITATEIHVAVGPSDTRVRQLAVAQRPQLIVLGAAQRSAWQRLFGGAGTLALIGSIPTDIVVVPPSATLLQAATSNQRVMT